MDGTGPALQFVPTPVSNSPHAALFESDSGGTLGESFRASFLGRLEDFVGKDVARLRTRSPVGFDAGESAVEGDARPDYANRVASNAKGPAFLQAMFDRMMGTTLPICPFDDPISPQAILTRAAALSCAGCHAPERVLSPDRRLGCGMVWPESLGETHIDEQGHLSPALMDVFLPYRAEVLSTYLRACDGAAIRRNLVPAPDRVIPECFVAGTPVTMADGTERAIDRIGPGEMVLSYDDATGSLLPARVERGFVRAETDHLVVVNGSLVATPNHQFRTGRGWIAAELLRVGDALLVARDADPTPALALEAHPARVGALEARPGAVTTYNLAVEGRHAFFAGGVLVHDGP